ncbi:hypothetical protein ACR6AP_13695 [Klebsiella variicola]
MAERLNISLRTAQRVVQRLG